MLIHAKELEAYEVHAREGAIGRVADLIFDAERWTVRYFVVNTGSWLRRHQVLLVPTRLKRETHLNNTFVVDATREQVEHSPSIDAVRTVSREQEQLLLAKATGNFKHGNER